MTELEKQLSAAFTALSTQYAQDVKRLESQNSILQQQVAGLSSQVGSLNKMLSQLDQKLTALVES